MKKPFFIMAYSQNGGTAMPIVESTDENDYNDDVAFFETEKEARKTAEKQILCKSFGYEIFKMGDGE